MRIVAFSGPKYSGKDTAAKGLLECRLNASHNVFRLAKMAEGVKNICVEAFGYTEEMLEDPVAKETKTEIFPFIEPRWSMMDIANYFRDRFGGTVWCERWERITREADANWACHIITDLRFPEELAMLQRLGGMIIYVHRPEAEEALASKQSAGDAMSLNPSEAHYKLIRESADHIIYNDTSIASLHGQVQALVAAKWGHWNYWEAEENFLTKMRLGRDLDDA